VWYALAVHHGAEIQQRRPLTVLAGRQRPTGGWGFDTAVPPDADSTAWSLLALATMPVWRPSAIARARRYLQLHQRSDSGGFSTYAPLDGIDRYIDVPPVMTRGWLASHSCVTAVVTQALLAHGEARDSPTIRRAAEYLLRERDGRGLWNSYWWRGSAYSTYHALRALIWCRALDWPDLRSSACVIQEHQERDGSWCTEAERPSAFETAWAVLALMLEPVPMSPAADRGIEWLLAAQQADGGWPTTPILQIPWPNASHPDEVAVWSENGLGTGVVIEDRRGLFTSAACVWALSIAQARRGTSRATRSQR
jgi:squalene-hopene/tetraprenyl-beta-curcumene cyclase